MSTIARATPSMPKRTRASGCSSARRFIAPANLKPANLNEPHLTGLIDGLPAGMHRELLINLLHMGDNGMLRDTEQSGDLAEAKALGNKTENLRLPHRERSFLGRAGRRRNAARLEPLEQLPGDHRADRRPAGAQLFD